MRDANVCVRIYVLIFEKLSSTSSVTQNSLKTSTWLRSNTDRRIDDRFTKCTRGRCKNRGWLVVRLADIIRTEISKCSYRSSDFSSVNFSLCSYDSRRKVGSFLSPHRYCHFFQRDFRESYR